MTPNNCRIICASAGTGKTYRLSLEYLSLILKYYGNSEFSLDNILVLTFTRKATAEIRERIIKHLELLLATPETEEEQKEQRELLQNLRILNNLKDTSLSEQEKNLLLSARKEIICDQSHLQVMTIDSYTGHIFRNIVRPLRNIERYEIDTQAVQKIMPFLLDHLMQPELRTRFETLLSRKVSRSLDDYTSFFRSLIEQRWLFYMLTMRIAANPSLNRNLLLNNPKTDAEKYKQNFLQAMQQLISQVNEIRSAAGHSNLEDYFLKDFKALAVKGALTPIEIMQNLKELTPDTAEKLLTIMDKSNIWNKQKISVKKYNAENIELQQTQDEAKHALADYLMVELYLPEQEEILTLWASVLKEYDRLIYRYKKLTYEDITWFTFAALFSEEPPFLDPASADSATEFYQFLSHRTRFLLIDEFQDTSLIQFNVLKPIIEEITAGEGSKPFGGLIVVGDEKQSIFGWRGGERDLLLHLKDIFPALNEVEIEALELSYRCGPTLMEFLNKVFANAELHNLLQEKEMQWKYNHIDSAAIQEEPGTEIEFCLKNFSTSATNDNDKNIYTDFVERMVKPALEKDASGSIAILCRTNEELAKIQQTLDNSQITSLFQPNRSVISHHFVAPLMSWLRFLSWGDWIDFIAFLRSDYVLINTKVLKQTLNVISRIIDLQKDSARPVKPNFSAIPVVNEFYQLSLKQQNKQATAICREIIDLCLPDKQPNERDYLNLHRFLDIMATYQLTSADKGTSLPDLLNYLQENAASDDFKQVSVNADNSLQLLTIHKSKGLQFKRVFVFYNFSGKHNESNNTLDWALEYEGKTFNHILDYGISLHYQKILKSSSYANLYLQAQKRKQLEEMNNLYVAFTRAKQKLHLYFGYTLKEGWDEYYNAHKDKNLPAVLCNAVLSYFQNTTPNEQGIYRQKGCLEENGKDTNAASKPSLNTVEQVNARFKICHQRTIASDELVPKELPRVKDLKNYYLTERPNLIGDLLHFYLSFIIRNEAKEHQYALRRCLNRYGAILPVSQIEKLAMRCQNVCTANPYLFTTGWNKIFTEQEIIFSGNVLRIDRLMVNTTEKEALIADYKSGDSYDPKQLSEYKTALIMLPVFKGYNINTRIVNI
ncbi:MAG TPA: UvrD-helicase domain-containing protein [Candidatus Cloacimonas sp.]|nr:UvrD-helicase domain-containing protein [Candidatus Cloacimonas sp.]